MATPTVDSLIELIKQLSKDEQEELMRRLETLDVPYQRPSTTLKVFHVEKFPEHLTLRREDEYGDER